MKCERCEVREAEVHFTVIRDTVATTEHLCQVCSGGAVNEDLPAAIKSLYDFMLTEPGALTQDDIETIRRLSEAIRKDQDEQGEPKPPAEPS
jgi:protein-arginine kinase activator protein McsA